MKDKKISSLSHCETNKEKVKEIERSTVSN